MDLTKPCFADSSAQKKGGKFILHFFFLRGWDCLGFKSKLFSHKDMFGSFWMDTEVDFIKVLAPLEEWYLWLHSRTKSSILLHKAAFYCVTKAGKTLEELPEREAILRDVVAHLHGNRGWWR